MTKEPWAGAERRSASLTVWSLTRCFQRHWYHAACGAQHCLQAFMDSKQIASSPWPHFSASHLDSWEPGCHCRAEAPGVGSHWTLLPAAECSGAVDQASLAWHEVCRSQDWLNPLFRKSGKCRESIITAEPNTLEIFLILPCQYES